MKMLPSMGIPVDGVAYCSDCGKPVGPLDFHCANCGHQIRQGQSSQEPHPRPSRGPFPPSKRFKIAIAVLFVGGILVMGLFTYAFVSYFSTLTFPYTGTNTESVQVTIQGVQCSQPGGLGHPLACSVILSNSGATDLIITGCSILVGETDQPGFSSVSTIRAGEYLSGVGCTTISSALTEPPLVVQAAGSFNFTYDEGLRSFTGQFYGNWV